MYDAIKDWIIANFGLSALIFMAVVALAVYIGGWVMKFKKDIENLPCEDHRRSLSDNQGQISKTEILLHRIEGQVTTIPSLEARFDSFMERLDAITRTFNERQDAISKDFNERQDAISKTFAERLDIISKDFNERLDTRIESVHARIDNVNQSLQILAAGGSGRSNLTQSHSPISLSEKGRKIAEELRLSDMVDSNWGSISSIITDEKNPYDIQMQFISRLILEHTKFFDPVSLDKIKTDAFMQGIPLIEYMRMAGIIARDRYFQEHGIDISEVDESDPSGHTETPTA